MIRLGQLKIPVQTPAEEREALLLKKAGRLLRRSTDSLRIVKILRRSLDARRKPELFYVYTIAVETGMKPEQEQRLCAKLRNKEISIYSKTIYCFPSPGSKMLSHRPVVIGAGPAGLFCALFLAEHGYRPLLVERGRSVERRAEDIRRFWETGRLDPDSNVQFGEGGAGAFSDGKLNSGIGDPSGRASRVLEIFTECGAPSDICYEARPHVGTDRLQALLPVLRERILSAGGEIRFETCCTGLEISEGKITGVHLHTSAGQDPADYIIPAEVAVLAPGHSARDTFRWLRDSGIQMAQKPFAMGYRVSHPQTMIDSAQYGIQKEADVSGTADPMMQSLPAASYRLRASAADGRGVYSFCMCPGGYIVNASSEPGGTAVNGMSDRARDSGRANSAIVVTVRTEDFGSDDVLAGVDLQRKLELRAFERGNGGIPIQRFPDMERNEHSTFSPEETEGLSIRGQYVSAGLRGLMPAFIEEAFMEGMHAFDRQIPGFSGREAVVAGIESRTSSPVRIVRDNEMTASVEGLIPCGEGAGYAGGILSAAVDGIRAAEQIASEHAPL